MKKIYVLGNDAFFQRDIDIYLDKSIYQVYKPNITVNNLFNFIIVNKPDVVIIHSSFINGYYQIFDMLLSQLNTIIIYVSEKMGYDCCYNAINQINFYMISSEKIVALSEVINILIKNNLMYNTLQKEVDKYKNKIEEDRIVRKAKVLLMNSGMSEDDAYKVILKKSMDERVTKGIASKKIIQELN